MRALVHSICFLPLLLCLQMSLIGQAGSEQTASITSALRAREFDKALELLATSLHRAPNNPQLWMFQGLALLREKRFEIRARIVPARDETFSRLLTGARRRCANSIRGGQRRCYALA